MRFRLDTIHRPVCSDSATAASKCDCVTSLANNGDFPFLAISRITYDENSRVIAAN